MPSSMGFVKCLNVINKTKMILPCPSFNLETAVCSPASIESIIKILFYNLFMPSSIWIFKMFECNTQNENDSTSSKSLIVNSCVQSIFYPMNNKKHYIIIKVTKSKTTVCLITELPASVLQWSSKQTGLYQLADN